MRVYNTLSRRLEEFAPLESGAVRMYTCGPTVYNFAHVGNFRAYTFEDLLRRYLKFSGWRVTQVMNLTDVDDKTIRGAKQAGVSLGAFTAPFTQAFFEDLKVLNIEPAEHYPAATAHIPEMIALIERLFAAGYAYRSEDGSVYFNVGRFADYGRLANLDASALRAGARVAHDEYDKANVADFALWKAWDPEDGDVAWESPWGKGRPGWHIECSAMSMKYLGESFDIHTGGADNIFPHHVNEIAQSEGATGRRFVKCWMHCGYLVVDGAKMSKSLGNFHTLRDLLARGWTGREIRYVLLSAHYRAPLNFTFDALGAARSALKRLDDFRDRLEELGRRDPDSRRLAWAGGDVFERSGGGESEPTPTGTEWARMLERSEVTGMLPMWAWQDKQRFVEALDDDLNMPEALGALFEMVSRGNRSMDAGKLEPGDAWSVLAVLDELDQVLGYLAKPQAAGPGTEVETLLAQREAARKARNWAEGDRIRKRLAEMGWELRDTPEGPKVKRK